MNRYALLFVLVFGLAACGSEEAAETGSNVVEACTDLVASDVCPAGTALSFDAQAVADCGGSVGASVDLTSRSGEISGRCGSSGECSFVCAPPDPCCGGEEWTETSYKCETPCAAVCACEGKCGKISGADCDADCGTCSGGQVCSADNVCVDECPEGAEVCGDACFFPVDGDVCFNGEVCEAEKNCEGKACGSNGCGGECGKCQGSESCDNGQCVSDCKGSLPVCQGALIQACQSTNPDDADAGWAWQDDTDCDTPGTDTPYCAELASGATCVECNGDSDDQCGVGKACDLEKGVCIDTCVPDCTNDDGTKRYCGGDGCGGFCEGVDYSCNGNGNWCNPDNGKCDTPLEECSFSFQQMVNDEPSDTWMKVVIPYGNPFCNSVVPDLGIILDDELPPEAVVSGHVDMGTPDENGNIAESFENVCTWTIHEFDSGNKVKCGEELCSMIAIPMDQNPIEYIKKTKLNEEDFCCKEASTCEDFGLLENQAFCNTPDHPAFQTTKSDTWCVGDAPAPIEEGILLRCSQKGKVTEFKCENCEEENDGSWTSKCSQQGWGCFTSEVGECSEDDGPCENQFPAGTEVGSCQESQESFCDDYEPWCLYDEGGEGAPPKTYTGCSWDPVTNEIDEFANPTTCEGNTICVDQLYTDEEKPPCDNEGGCDADDPEAGPWWWKTVPATCQEADPCPSNGQMYDEYCNAADNPGHDPTYPETMRMRCEVQNGVAVIGPKYSGMMGIEESDCSWANDGNEYGFPSICVDKVNDEGSPYASCEMDLSGACENSNFFQAQCDWIAGEGLFDEATPGLKTCTYDAETNEAKIETVPCPNAQVCVDHDWICDPTNPTNCVEDKNWNPVCEDKDTCPAKKDFMADDWPNQWCNVDGQPGYQSQFSAQGTGLVDCWYHELVNQPIYSFNACPPGDLCFPGGPNDDPESGQIHAPQCAALDVCNDGDNKCIDEGPTGSAGMTSQKCMIDQNTNHKWYQETECPDAAACYYGDENGDLSELPKSGSKGICEDRSCGAPIDGSQGACYDLDDLCYIPDNGAPIGATQLFDQDFFGEAAGGIEIPNFACLPESGCPEDGTRVTVTLNPTGNETLKYVHFIANDSEGDNGTDVTYFQRAGDSSDMGFVFVCYELKDGSGEMPNDQQNIYLPLPGGQPGSGGNWSSTYCGETGSNVTADTIKCCACAWKEWPAAQEHVTPQWCEQNCEKAAP